MHNSKKGFTLAEVLITLAIIGVVASLTIPTLITNTNSQRFQTALKKEVSMLNQSLMTSISQDAKDASLSGMNSDSNLAGLFKTYLTQVKDDGAGTLWLVDGSKISFNYVANKTCGATTNAGVVNAFDPSNAGAVTGYCYALVDVNGDKGPNTMSTGTNSSDVYVLAILPTIVTPVGAVSAAVTPDAGFLKDSANVTASPAYNYATLIPGNASINAVTGGST